MSIKAIIISIIISVITSVAGSAIWSLASEYEYEVTFHMEKEKK
ncbi:hypothetical protein DFP93_103133 [Aneurinibacillus soli]|uniref:Uncharacterized protein n=1 Tax=Aneurinibacillus soli TaxID=1500254 RepID=A0A0U5AZ27_9BACL|nr:hypothetical protein [Aneurinibacillus soli]PYE62923.1 hypothetical protein DFP93_103133 [Aneurinibacillus soli]BAU29018.1 hypothetical protein CB4_03196 [Aneurinibacillus soli]